jgi:hypothetical protein
MNKVKVLSAAALANMTAVGFAAAPALASTHSPAGAAVGTATAAVSTATAAVGTATAAVPSAGRSHPGITFVPRGSVTTATAATAAKLHGFVPRTAKGVRPDTEVGCDNTSPGHKMCLELEGGGTYVSSVLEYFQGTTGCHIPWISVSLNGTILKKYTGGYQCSGSLYGVAPHSYYAPGTNFCGHFQNVAGKVCEPIR